MDQIADEFELMTLRQLWPFPIPRSRRALLRTAPRRTHAAISSAPNSFLHFSLFAHMSFALGISNLRARRKRSRVWSSNRS